MCIRDRGTFVNDLSDAQITISKRINELYYGPNDNPAGLAEGVNIADTDIDVYKRQIHILGNGREHGSARCCQIYACFSIAGKSGQCILFLSLIHILYGQRS